MDSSFFSFFFLMIRRPPRSTLLSLHDALPILPTAHTTHFTLKGQPMRETINEERSEEHTSELQSRLHLVCRLLLEKKKPEADTPRRLRMLCRAESHGRRNACPPPASHSGARPH